MRAPRQRFFCDAMLGRLATWLRVFGMDVEYERDIDDEDLIGRAIKEDRLILTRDTLLVKRRILKDRAFFVHGDHFEDQLKEVVGRFGFERGRFFSRCLRCNLPLVLLPAESVKGRVPTYVFDRESHFSTCRGCGRVYWPGTHREEMEKVIERVLHGGR